MNASLTTVAVRISDSHGKSAPGEVRVQTWDGPARTRRAVKWLAILWGLGTFSVLLPILHFFLVPGLLVAGPVVAFLMSQQASVVLGGTGKCPSCGADFSIVRANYLKPSDQWPLNDSCASCRADVLIDRA